MNNFWLKKQIEKNSVADSQVNEQLSDTTQQMNGILKDEFLEINKPIVSFEFDDGYDDIYANVYPILSANNYQASIAIDYLAFKNLTGRLTPAHANELYNKNWEYLSHSYSHPYFDDTLSDEDAEKELKSSKDALNQLFNVKGFVAPFGGGAYLNKIDLVKKYYDYSFYAYKDLPIDTSKSMYILNRISMDKDITTLKSLVDTAITNNQWIVLWCHHVGVDGAEITTADFQTLVEYINSKSITVMTSGEVVKQYTRSQIQGESISELKQNIDNNKIVNHNYIKNSELSSKGSYKEPIYWDYVNSTSGTITLNCDNKFPQSKFKIKFGTNVVDTGYVLLSQKISINNFVSPTKFRFKIMALPTANVNVEIVLQQMNGDTVLDTLIDETISNGTHEEEYIKDFILTPNVSMTNVLVQIKLSVSGTLSADQTVTICSPTLESTINKSSQTKYYGYFTKTAQTQTSQNIFDKITFSSQFDTLVCFSTDTFACNRTGIYLICANIGVTGTTKITDFRIRLFKNATTLITPIEQTVDFTSLPTQNFNIVFPAYLSKGDTLYLGVYKDDASTITIKSSSTLAIIEQ